MNFKTLGVITLATITGSYATTSAYQASTFNSSPEIPHVVPYADPQVSKDPKMKQEGKQKVLCLMVEVGDQTFAQGIDEDYYYNEIFGNDPDSVKNFLDYSSNGKFGIEPIQTPGSSNPGIVKVHIEDEWGTIGAAEFEKQTEIAHKAIQAATGKVTWSDADKNNDKKFDESFIIDDPAKKEELLIYTMIAGATADTDSRVDGDVLAWPHLTRINTQSDGYTFTNTSVIASSMAQGTPVNRAILNHEFLHNLNARDMYKDEHSIGPWSVMCDTYGKRADSDAVAPTPLDPMHMLFFEWATPSVITPTEEPQELTYSRDKVYIVKHPTNDDIVYCLDYRCFDDPVQKSLHKSGVNGDGIVVWKINKTEAQRDWNDDWLVNSKGPYTAMSVLAKRAGTPDANNSYIPIGYGAKIDGTELNVRVKDKKMIVSLGELEPPTPDEITIEASNREIEVGQDVDYREGVIVRDKDGNIITDKANLKVEVAVDNSKPGQGTVKYTASYNGATTSLTITVTVKEKEQEIPDPVIHAENKTIKVGEEFKPKEGVTATDGKGEDITASLQVKHSNVDSKTPGVYTVVYEVSDRYGNTVTKTITVTVVKDDEVKPPKQDTTPPVIKGADAKVLHVGDEFNALSGVTATDDVDGPVEVKVVSNEVNLNKPGKYKVIYEAVDKAGNRASITRMVEVLEVETPGDDLTGDKIFPDLKVLDTTIKVPAGHIINPKYFVSATDNKDGDLTNKIKIDGKVPDLSKSGTYKVNYYVEDKSGNRSEATINFIVYNYTGNIYAPSYKIVKGGTFNPLDGVTAVSSNGLNMNRKLKIEGANIDTSKPGKHKVTYSFEDVNGKTVSVTRDVEVVDSKITYPTLEFTQSVYIKGEKADIKADVVAKDASGKDISKDVRVVSGEIDFNTTGYYPVVYEVSDADGNTTQVVKYAIVTTNKIDKGAPVIKVLSNKVFKGSTFVPQSLVTAIDYEDGLINDKIVVENNTVNINKIGRYEVVYSVVDKDGNRSTKTVPVDVIEGNDTDNNGNGNDNENNNGTDSDNNGTDNNNGDDSNNSENTDNSNNNASSNDDKQQSLNQNNSPMFNNVVDTITGKKPLPKTGVAVSSGSFIALILAFITRKLR